MEVEKSDENAWELSKENVQPLRTGRRMCELRKALDKDVVTLQNETQLFEMKLRNTANEQAKLEIWYSYITWREQNYTQSNKETIELMQRCLLHFQSMNEFRQNELYVNIWLKLIERFEDAGNFFTYMYDNDIGTSQATYYKAWADHSEIIGSLKKADELYTLGINRNASPVDWLKHCKKDFEQRMLKKSQPKEENIAALNQPTSRTVLGSLKPGKSGRVGNDRSKSTFSCRSHTITGGNTSQVTNVNSNSNAFQIYGDENFASASLPAPSGQMKEFPAQSKLHKENEKAMGIMKGTRLRNTGSVSSTTSARHAFEIYHEEETPAVSATPKQVIVGSRKPLSSKKREEKTEHFYNKIQTNDPNTVVKYCKQLIYMGTKEVSFEELRAQLPKYKNFNFTTPSVIPQKKTACSSLAFADVEMKENTDDQFAIKTLEKPTKLKPVGTDVEMASNSNTPINQILSSLGSNKQDERSEIASRFPAEQKVKRDLTSVVSIDVKQKLEELDTTRRFTKTTVSNLFDVNQHLEELDGTMCRNMFNALDVTRIDTLSTSQQLNNKNNLGSPMYESTSYFGGKNKQTGIGKAAVENLDLTHVLDELDMTKHTEFTRKTRGLPDRTLGETTSRNKVIHKLDETRTNRVLSLTNNDADCSGIEPLSHSDVSNHGKALQSEILNESIDFQSKMPGIEVSCKQLQHHQQQSPTHHHHQQQQQQFQPPKQQPQQHQELFHRKELPTQHLQQHSTMPAENYGFVRHRDSSEQKAFEIDDYTNTTNNQSLTTNQSFAAPSPTINTKEAFQSTDKLIQNIFMNSMIDGDLTFDDLTTTKSKQFKIDSVVAKNDERVQKQGFSIFQDDGAQESKSKGFSIFQDINDCKPKEQKAGFSIFQDGGDVGVEEQQKSSGSTIFQDNENNQRLTAKQKPHASFHSCLDREHQPRTSFNLYQDPECMNASSPELNNEPKQNNPESLSESRNVMCRTVQFCPDEVTTRVSSIPASERPVSTPAAAQDFKGSVTFGGNISSFYGFENLSTITECSGESERSRKDGSSNDESLGHHDNVMVEAFSAETIETCVERVIDNISTFERFLKINGALPKLIGDSMELCLGPQRLRIDKQLRKGGSQSTYKAMNRNNKTVALTICKLTNKTLLWEFYVANAIHERLDVLTNEDFHKSFIQPSFVYKYSDAMCFESPFYSEGSLMDLIALHKKHQQCMEEALVLLYAFEIVLIVYTLHQINIIHCDINPNSFLLGNCELTEAGPFVIRALSLSEFGKSIDLNMLPENTLLTGSNGSDSFECPPMKNGKPWKYQVDNYAAAATIHMLVFQNSMNTYTDPKTGMLKICNVPRRDWNEQLWSNLFFTLINTTDGCEALVELMQDLMEELKKPSTLSKLKDAIMNKNDLLMSDDD